MKRTEEQANDSRRYRLLMKIIAVGGIVFVPLGIMTSDYYAACWAGMAAFLAIGHVAISQQEGA